MLESINIKQVASYDGTGIQITDLKKINFIYGANGCGKTTISNFLHNPVEGKFSNCLASWKNEQSLKTLVYNKQFRELNFGNGKMNGVFTLGKATKEEIEIIRLKNEDLKAIKATGILKRKHLTNKL
jgi:wobble nucleotide-excising tRNase